MKACTICNHESHDAGKCKNCNCGASEVSHSSATQMDHARVVTYENFVSGEVSTTDIKHIKPRRTDG